MCLDLLAFIAVRGCGGNLGFWICRPDAHITVKLNECGGSGPSYAPPSQTPCPFSLTHEMLGPWLGPRGGRLGDSKESTQVQATVSEPESVLTCPVACIPPSS